MRCTFKLQTFIMKLFFVCIAIVITVLIACTPNENQQKLIGKWAGVEWLVNDKPSGFNAQSTFFSFDDKGAYTYEYLGNKENGTYKVENEMLFTTPENQQEMMVKIAKLNKDTLIFDMNRGGQSEMLTLIRK